MAIEPQDDRLDELASHPPDEPVVMLNLLRFREQAELHRGVDGLTGKQAYRKYSEAFQKLHPRFGGQPIWMGRTGTVLVGADDEKWDIAILVEYPSRKDFISMLADAEYREVAPLRAAALADAGLNEMTAIPFSTE